jgi:hypothetical protein
MVWFGFVPVTVWFGFGTCNGLVWFGFGTCDGSIQHANTANTSIEGNTN